MFRNVFIATCLSFIVASSSVSAENPEGVFVVDVQKVLSASLMGKAARSNMEVEVKKSETRLAAQKQEFERLRADFAKQQAVLSKEAQEQKGESLKKKQRELELGLADEQDKLRRKNGDEIEKVLVEIRKILAQMANDKKYPVIIEKDPRLVVYVSPNLDLTEKVVAALDEQKLG